MTTSRMCFPPGRGRDPSPHPVHPGLCQGRWWQRPLSAKCPTQKIKGAEECAGEGGIPVFSGV